MILHHSVLNQQVHISFIKLNVASSFNVSTDRAMEQSHIKVLDKHKTYLLENLVIDETFEAQLRENEVLGIGELNELNHVCTVNLCLLSKIYIYYDFVLRIYVLM